MNDDSYTGCINKKKLYGKRKAYQLSMKINRDQKFSNNIMLYSRFLHSSFSDDFDSSLIPQNYNLNAKIFHVLR